MPNLPLGAVIFFAVFVVLSPSSHAKKGGNCTDAREPDITFIEYDSIDNILLPEEAQNTITVQGKLKLPVRCNWKRRGRGYNNRLPAVLILHGSAGVDSRGDYYARALNAAGIATLEIDYWEARGVVGVVNRPPYL